MPGQFQFLMILQSYRSSSFNLVATDLASEFMPSVPHSIQRYRQRKGDVLAAEFDILQQLPVLACANHSFDRLEPLFFDRGISDLAPGYRQLPAPITFDARRYDPLVDRRIAAVQLVVCPTAKIPGAGENACVG